MIATDDPTDLQRMELGLGATVRFLEFAVPARHGAGQSIRPETANDSVSIE